MTKLISAMLLTLLAITAQAQMRPPERALADIGDASMMVDDRGTRLEILPLQRAAIGTDAAGRGAIQRIAVRLASQPISHEQLGIVFNHAYQQYGYITGEIAFRLKGGQAPGDDFQSALYPNLKKIGTLDMYAVTAPDPQVFLDVLKRLQARTDLDWVVPTVTYFQGTE